MKGEGGMMDGMDLNGLWRREQRRGVSSSFFGAVPHVMRLSTSACLYERQDALDGDGFGFIVVGTSP